ncbi:polysaccharide pyruvyl transferase family protein [Tolypothrix sp. VBCCA 56010]|uniref:polysaccharide pyruvyl transferase family protein n=1 Tax=Tolypothrix sp. VBCCA 56010 TaxID=3137731 RepID=UPI003D7DD62C
MKILVEQSGYNLTNVGDLAMLQVAVERLKSFWPNASITIFTKAPEKLYEYCPDTLPLLPSGRQLWIGPPLHFVHNLIPSSKSTQFWRHLEYEIRRKYPYLLRKLIDFKLKRKPEQHKQFDKFMEVVFNADLVVATGGGYITDTFKVCTIAALETLELANHLGKPTVMLGQGLGPINSPDLINMAKDVLPSVDLISLREKRAGVPLLKSLGVSQERVITTGDDAIELAYRYRNTALGDGIGVNLRIAEYSGVNSSLLETVRLALHDAAKKWDAPLIPAPIDHSSSEGFIESDSVTIQKLLKGYDDNSDGGQNLNTPLKVIKQIGCCRVVVTGSYHAGVFALSQGIPVIALAKSEYYVDKFYGLADQFGVGCEVLLLNDPELEKKLVESITHAWESAEQLKPQLLEAAKRQIELAHTAYKRVFDLVNSR